MAAPSTRWLVPLLPLEVVASEKAGAAVSAFAGSGLDECTASDAGTVQSARVASGTDASLFAELAAAVSERIATGADTHLAIETVAGVLGLVAAGVVEREAQLYDKEGAGILDALALGDSDFTDVPDPIKADVRILTLVN